MVLKKGPKTLALTVIVNRELSLVNPVYCHVRRHQFLIYCSIYLGKSEFRLQLPVKADLRSTSHHRVCNPLFIATSLTVTFDLCI